MNLRRNASPGRLSPYRAGSDKEEEFTEATRQGYSSDNWKKVDGLSESETKSDEKGGPDTKATRRGSGSFRHRVRKTKSKSTETPCQRKAELVFTRALRRLCWQGTGVAEEQEIFYDLPHRPGPPRHRSLGKTCKTKRMLLGWRGRLRGRPGSRADSRGLEKGQATAAAPQQDQFQDTKGQGAHRPSGRLTDLVQPRLGRPGDQRRPQLGLPAPDLQIEAVHLDARVRQAVKMEMGAIYSVEEEPLVADDDDDDDDDEDDDGPPDRQPDSSSTPRLNQSFCLNPKTETLLAKPETQWRF